VTVSCIALPVTFQLRFNAVSVFILRSLLNLYVEYYLQYARICEHYTLVY